MKKFNVKVLSMAVAAAVVSGAASAEEVNFAQAIEGGKSNHGKAAFSLFTAKVRNLIQIPVS